MAIEIREVVVKATVSRLSSKGDADLVTKQELLKFQDKMMDRVLRKVKDMIADERSSR